MHSMNKTCLIVNFGGPRNLEEIRPFLTELLTDQDVIRTPLPAVLQTWLFRRVAKKRSLSIREEYQKMQGRSPIFDDTENLAKALPIKTLTFHRYLPQTHAQSLAAIENCNEEEIYVFPLFPQFSYATTGSIARFFQEHLSLRTLRKLRWIRSYAQHPAYIDCFTQHIRDYLDLKNVSDAALFFSPHGVPQSFVCTGDPYQTECETSFGLIKANFPASQSLLAYQSKFGRGQWLRPYTDEICASIKQHIKGTPTVVFIPLSFTSDHVETLVEVEDLYLPPVRSAGFNTLRCPAFNLSPHWTAAILKILDDSPWTTNEMLVRNARIKCPNHCRGGLCPYVKPLVQLDKNLEILASKTFCSKP